LPPLAPGGRIAGPSSAEQSQQMFEGLAFDLDQIHDRVRLGGHGAAAGRSNRGRITDR
jgi:hypothetical protein